MLTPNHENSPEHDHGFQIAPMVDVVFVLLLFFMACAGLKQIEHHLPIDVPKLGGEPSIDPPIFVDITASGDVVCNGTRLLGVESNEANVLREWLLKVAAVDPRTQIVIRPAADATHDRFVLVLGAVKKAGLSRITLG